MQASPPPRPAIVAPAPQAQQPTLADIEIVAGGIAYHVPVVGIPCNSNVVFISRVVRKPSQRMTVVVSCDGPGASLEVNDDVPVKSKR